MSRADTTGDGWRISYYDQHNPQLIITFGDRSVSFSCQGMSEDTAAWLAGVLKRQVGELIAAELRTADAARTATIRKVLGL